MTARVFDLAIIGGGVNGCGIARDAAGRGLSVFLCEERDLASGTSSASTKLIHGGLRYLEFYDFRLVHESLVERERLLHIAPHIIRPMRFVLPHHSGLRPWPVIRAGLFVYDHLAIGRTLPATRTLNLRADEAGKVLKPEYRRAFEYSDCAVDDSRLVVLNARDAADRGADVRTRTRCFAARRDGDVWRLTLHDGRGADHYETVTARALVNAGGPWVSSVVEGVTHTQSPTRIRLVKGSHIVVDRIFDHDRAYLFQNADGRVIFAIPYQRDYTLIGTTDQDYRGDPAEVAISDDERNYLLAAIGEYFAKPVDPATIRWTYAGVRPLDDDGSAEARKASRDYALELDTAGGAPLLNIFGGKLTTYRRLAEHAMAKLKPFFPDARGAWTAATPLPGGDIVGFDAWSADMMRRYPTLEGDTVLRLCHAYGTRIEEILGDASASADLGRDFGHGLTEREVAYLVANEWAQTADDILWRRTKLGLRFTPEQTAALTGHLEKPRT
jgi:glycerol-3-phosphate dehydrogenase